MLEETARETQAYVYDTATKQESELLGKLKLMRLPPLAVGIGIYLPMAVILPVAIGSILGWFYDRWSDRQRDAELAKRMGVLTATGMIVGESLWGVAFAGIVAASGTDSPLALAGEGFVTTALIGGTVLFIVLTALLYRYARAAAR